MSKADPKPPKQEQSDAILLGRNGPPVNVATNLKPQPSPPPPPPKKP
jgi:hypothetical protein